MKTALLVWAFLLFQPAGQRGGEIHFTSGDIKPIVFISWIDGAKRDIDAVKIRYGQKVADVFGNEHHERLPELSLKGLQRIDLIKYSASELDEIRKIGTGCVGTDSCSSRKLTLTFRDGRKQANIFVNFLYAPGAAFGPSGERYNLGDYDIAAVVLK